VSYDGKYDFVIVDTASLSVPVSTPHTAKVSIRNGRRVHEFKEL
jgi:hypothetical protein